MAAILITVVASRVPKLNGRLGDPGVPCLVPAPAPAPDRATATTG